MSLLGLGVGVWFWNFQKWGEGPNPSTNYEYTGLGKNSINILETAENGRIDFEIWVLVALHTAIEG